MTSERLGATNNSKTRETSSSLCPGKMTIQTPFGLITTDCWRFWKKLFSTKDFVFKSKTSNYLFIEAVELGGTAITTKCRNQETGEIVVIKIPIDKDDSQSKAEKEILTKIKELGPDNYNIVKFYEYFNYKTKHCFVFEKLDIDLDSFTETIVGSGLHLSDIRLIAQQVLVALDFLHSNGIVHKDIKDNNMMLVDRSSLKLKVIDMGFSEEIGSMSNICANPLPYMPPEGIMTQTSGDLGAPVGPRDETRRIPPPCGLGIRQPLSQLWVNSLTTL
uniref:Protein kinase domain-containing protein n=1 Tax=Cyprinodon variegatus TaxID=28743 RepID=A0A3Q2EH70_CYPVA